MDEELVLRKLESLRRCLERIEGKVPGSPEELSADLDLQDIIVVNLERAVQVCVDVGSYILAGSNSKSPGSMAEVFLQLHQERFLKRETAEKMAKSVGFRNIAVHEYDSLDWNVVFSIITKELPVFRAFGREILTGKASD